ncbi:MAG: hypothetical protein KDH96_10080 [Candidatus Riesia sp.]|nr:hypothetical protein [Candidatus Riesia sp.]
MSDKKEIKLMLSKGLITRCITKYIHGLGHHPTCKEIVSEYEIQRALERCQYSPDAIKILEEAQEEYKNIIKGIKYLQAIDLKRDDAGCSLLIDYIFGKSFQLELNSNNNIIAEQKKTNGNNLHKSIYLGV